MEEGDANVNAVKVKDVDENINAIKGEMPRMKHAPRLLGPGTVVDESMC